jgi:cysteine desulfurase/selenocysteine lyase
LKFLELDSYFDLDLGELRNLVSEKTKIVSITLASNVLGTINDIKSIVTEIKKINKNIFVICDMTSAFGHASIDMSVLGKYIDAGYFSLHKAFGPTGVGVLWIKRDISRHMTPTILGGGIVSHVSRENFSLRSDIKAFEAGTSNIAGIIGVGEAVRFLNGLKNKSIEHSERLIDIFLKKIKSLNMDPALEINIFAGGSVRNVGIVSFQVVVNGQEVHPHDVAEIFSRFNISVRAGHHCAEPLMSYFNTPNGLTRVSFHIYNTEEDIDKVIIALKEVKKIFSR